MEQKEKQPSRFVHLRRSAERLRRLGERRLYARHAVVLRAGEIPSCCYFVCSGQVMGVKETEHGDELFMYVMEANSLFGEANMLFERRLPIAFRTTMPSELVRIERASLKKALEEEPALAMALLECVADKFFAAADENEKIKSHNATWLLCDLLVCLAGQYGVAYDEKVMIEKRFSIEALTSLLGVNRATTVRAIRALKDVGLLENINGYYCVRSIEKLRRHQELLTSF